MPRRPPPGEPCRFLTVRFSHFCEKARWALDRAHVPYREESHVPILSWGATFAAGGRRTVPVLVTSEQTLSDSTDILQWVDARAANGTPHLFPDGPAGADARDLEDQFDRRFGPATRRLAYFSLLPYPDLTRRLLASAGPPWQARATRIAYPLLRAVIVRGLRIDAAGAERSAAVVEETCTLVEQRLADGRRYLTGDVFTAADLTFAALATPLLQPDKLDDYVPSGADVPESMRVLAEKFRSRPAGRFAARMYEEERGTPGSATWGR